MEAYKMPVIQIAGYNFEGPFLSTDPLREEAGLYVILTQTTNGWTVVDNGEASGIKSRIDTHDRAQCWKRHAVGKLGVAVLYTPGWTLSQRMALEQQIRQMYNPACGKR